jgi:hypothetical protein
MAQRRHIRLTAEKLAELTKARDTAEQPYVRERAAAIIKVAEGQTPHAVARRGLLKPHDPDTVYAWLDRYAADGIAGLRVRPGRGRKPAFSPSPSDGRGGQRGRARHRRA